MDLVEIATELYDDWCEQKRWENLDVNKREELRISLSWQERTKVSFTKMGMTMARSCLVADQWPMKGVGLHTERQTKKSSVLDPLQWDASAGHECKDAVLDYLDM